ncbi:MAG: hypothetical protein EHM61_19120 [Acidobacteria bacterium]|nr:MAG: hypothetical protein EHM61_19120 [Acidobacteriota bacterium]
MIMSEPTAVNPENAPGEQAGTLPKDDSNPPARVVFWRRAGRRIMCFFRRVKPGPRAWRGAAVGTLLAAGLAYLLLAVWVVVVAKDNLAVYLIALVLPAVSLLGSALGLLLIRLLNRLPSFYLWALLTSLMAGAAYGGLGPWGVISSILACVLVGSLLGASIRIFAAGGWRDLSKLQRAVTVGGLILGLGLAGFITWWLVNDGHAGKPVSNAALETSQKSGNRAQGLSDPSQPGPNRVLRLTYGSGSDRHRPEYAERVTIRTRTVDGSRLVGNWSGRKGWARTRYWGFDAKKLPLQARVWYPEGNGPFPLVLIVHGNHLMEEYSDPGYAYLGELMASRGFIFASVDENFLNSSPGDLTGFPGGGLKEENDTRGWLLLEHLRLWRDWNKSAGHVFSGRVDMDRIAVAGHSRGGEAATVAGVFNRLPYYPDDARVRFDFGFNIRSIVAIAPVDGQYKPAGAPARLQDLNYFVLHGSWDGDMRSFHGSRVLERASFKGDGDWFKSSLYIHQANHGQFNTVWGRSDAGGPYTAFLNLRPILPPADQRKIAQVFLCAFLEATLHDRREFRRLMRDWRAGAPWLPKTVYLQKYEEARSNMLATFEEDLDVTTTTASGGRIAAENLSDWKERAVDIKWGGLDTRGVFLGWNRKEAPGPCSYLIQWPEAGLAATPEGTLFFSLADSKNEPASYKDDEGEQKEKKSSEEQKKKSGEGNSKDQKKPIDLTLELTDGSGNRARLPLSHFGKLQPQIETDVVKASFMTDVPGSEVVFQTFEFPLAAFHAANSRLDTAALRSLRFVFDRSEKGVIILDGIGFRRD